MGTPLRTIVEDNGRRRARRRQDQGRADRRPFRRLHPGRSTSTRRSITNRSTKLGSIMGSGGMIVMDETTHMVDVARFFMEFCMDESCGKCIPCRAGTVQMHQPADKILGAQGHRARPGKARRAVRHGQEHQPLRPGPDRAQPGAEHAALLPQRIRRSCSSRTPTRPDGNGKRQASEPASRRLNLTREHSMAAKTSDHRRQTGQRRRRARRSCEAATEAGITIPTLCHLDGVYDVGACRLCLVEVAGTPKLLPACTTRVRRGHGGQDRQRAAAQVPPDDAGTAVRRAQPRLRGLRGQRPLRAADAGLQPGHGPRPLRLLLPEVGGGHHAPRCSAWTTTAASSAPAACASAGRSKAPAPGTSPAAAASPASSPT